jgi:hypothetical protein
LDGYEYKLVGHASGFVFFCGPGREDVRQTPGEEGSKHLMAFTIRPLNAS